MERRKGHAVMVPFATAGHMNPMLKLAKLLHSHGFHVTYVITHYNLHCITKSVLLSLVHDGFRIEAVSDGLPPSGRVWPQYMDDLAVASETTLVSSLRELVTTKLADDPTVPPVSCIVTGLMGPALAVAEEIGVPSVLFWRTSACGFVSTMWMDELVGRGILPLKDESFFTNGYLDTVVDWLPGLRPLRLRDITSFVNTTDPNDFNLHFNIEAAVWASRASAVILNTFDDLEHATLEAMKPKFKRLYTVGPISAIPYDSKVAPSIADIHLNLWREETECLSWLDKQEPGSVLYVSFGSVSTMEAWQLAEFAWGIARSKVPFLWILRSDIVAGKAVALPEGFVQETEGRGFVCGWCSQEEVMAHPSVGGFVTHGGWNSMLEGLRRGVPMVCWPAAYADQPTNCRYGCEEWGVAMEAWEGEVERGKVEAVVRELMGGEVGRALRLNCRRWKERAEGAVEIARKNVVEFAKHLGCCHGDR